VSQVDRKLEILERLMEKYQPEGGYQGVRQEILKRTEVIEISIREMTGKEHMG
jgi:nitroimidazol reductase NimA-like FMN-containing flavoprotein (pyridoxamine 5'-phosphate oxidase superfamily)